jgi:hypothetical protein
MVAQYVRGEQLLRASQSLSRESPVHCVSLLLVRRGGDSLREPGVYTILAAEGESERLWRGFRPSATESRRSIGGVERCTGTALIAR